MHRWLVLENVVNKVCYCILAFFNGGSQYPCNVDQFVPHCTRRDENLKSHVVRQVIPLLAEKLSAYLNGYFSLELAGHMLNKQWQEADKGWSSSLWRESSKWQVRKCHEETLDVADFSWHEGHSRLAGFC
jgi:hypothetical protein